MYNVEFEQFVALKSSYRALIPYIEDEKEESICVKFKQECSMKLQEATGIIHSLSEVVQLYFPLSPSL